MIPESFLKELPQARRNPGGNPIAWSARLHLIKNLLLGRVHIVKSTYAPRNKNSKGLTYPEITIVDKRSQL